MERKEFPMNLRATLRIILLLQLLVAIAGCAPNIAYRTEGGEHHCPAEGCKNAVLEHHQDYDLAFVEFTDRGNVFSRERMEQVLQYVQTKAGESQGANVILFVHGWKHNASPADENLASFRRMLQQTTVVQKGDKRHIIGIYVGWRGLSLKVGGVRNLSYWARKNVARDVGTGGLTEFLVKLERNMRADNDPNKNILIMTGHSFGGLVLISALKDVLIERLVNTTNVPNSLCGKNAASCSVCKQTQPFSHALVLVNPAVEANEILQLKELAAKESCYARSQAKLIHIVSSKADLANKTAFQVGQYLGMSLHGNENVLEREYKGKKMRIHERDLDITTAGNSPLFRTALSIKRTPQNEHQCDAKDRQRDECYIPCLNGECLSQDSNTHIAGSHYEPLHFLYTDSDYIAGHNDVFNAYIAGYISAVTVEASFRRLLGKGVRPENMTERDVPHQCTMPKNRDFDFPNCFDLFKRQFEVNPATHNRSG